MITANLFVDWDTASRVIPFTNKSDAPVQTRVAQIGRSYSELRERIIDGLIAIDGNTPIKILKTRIYHGWHRGTSPTPDRVAWEQYRGEIRPLKRKNISFLPDIEFGNDLLCRGIRMPIFDTLRPDRNNPSICGQKMVDTALVSDLLSYCRSESSGFRPRERPNTLAVVIGDDDDLLPGVFVAEAWGLPTYVFRIKREHDNKYLKTNGIISRI